MTVTDLPTEPAARHDVLIVGGGLVGASLAIALARAGIDAALVEATAADAMPAVFDQRNLSFAEATVNALQALQVMPLLQQPAAPIRRIHASRRGDVGRVWLAARDYGREQFGQVVVASDFGQALETRLQALPQLQRYRPARFTGLADAPAGWRGVRIETDGEALLLHTRLLVAADGMHSSVRTALGIAADSHDYDQTLFVARLRSERAPDGTAYERLTDDGPTALLPRGDRHYGVVHAVPTAQADAVSALDDAAFLERVQDAFGWRAGRFTAVGPRSRYPALRLQAQSLIAPRAVVIGNAAQSLHPVGAQGFNLGLRDALTLAELLQQSGIAGIDDGLLQRYVQRRQADRERTLAFSDGLARLTANPLPLLSGLRSLGMAAIDRSASLQSWLVGGAMGYRGDVPALCRESAA